MNEKEFQKAIKNPLFRQNFIDKIDLAESAPYIESISYIPLHYRYILMDTNHPKRGILTKNKKIKSTINIYPLSFSREQHFLYQDFLSSLLDHEGHHAKEFYFHTNRIRLNFNIKSIAESLLEKILDGKNEKLKKEAISLIYLYKQEIRADTVQLLKAKSRGISQEYKQTVEIRKQKTIDALKSLESFYNQSKLQAFNNFLQFTALQEDFLKF